MTSQSEVATKMTQDPPPLTVPDEPLDWRVKGLLANPSGGPSGADLVGSSVFDGPFGWPLLTLQASAVEHNVAALARFCTERSVDLAPHVKTTMAPALIRRQLDAGASALTVATSYQLQVVRRLGARRILVANQLVDGRALRWLAAELTADDDFECCFYVDSLAGVAAAASAMGPRRFRVLVEVGFAGGRTGCRDEEGIAAVAGAAVAAGLEVVGVSGFEGMLPDERAVREFLGRIRAAAVLLQGAGLLTDAEPAIVSAGGSAWFDVVADELTTGWPEGMAVRPLLRSGCYVGHDDGIYAATTPYAERIGGTLRPALRLWAQVISAPEPGLALVGFGKRDASFDAGLPVALEVRGVDGVRRPAAGLGVVRMDDQHAYLTVAGAGVSVGEVVRFGISHPCTVFDRWSAIPLVDDDERVLEVLRTYF
jgi:D-serine deaminase-like pyridoxal phosphate-dependent protein